jgi:hypothetical protein
MGAPKGQKYSLLVAGNSEPSCCQKANLRKQNYLRLFLFWACSANALLLLMVIALWLGQRSGLPNESLALPSDALFGDSQGPIYSLADVQPKNKILTNFYSSLARNCYSRGSKYHGDGSLRSICWTMGWSSATCRGQWDLYPQPVG